MLVPLALMHDPFMLFVFPFFFLEIAFTCCMFLCICFIVWLVPFITLSRYCIFRSSAFQFIAYPENYLWNESQKNTADSVCNPLKNILGNLMCQINNTSGKTIIKLQIAIITDSYLRGMTSCLRSITHMRGHEERDSCDMRHVKWDV